MTEPELIEGILRRDREAFQFLVHQYQNKVIKNACYFVGNMEDAEDLAQDIFLEIIRSIGSFKGNCALSTWIYRITVSKSLNMVKKQQRRGMMIRIESLFKRPAATNPGTMAEPFSMPQDFDQKEQRELLHAAINKLPVNQRVAFVLHNFEDQPYKQVAEIMNLNLPAIESLIHRAKKNLHKQLLHQFPEFQKD